VIEMKEEIFGMAMGVTTGFTINLFVFGKNLITAFITAFIMTLFWCWFYRRIIKPRFNKKTIQR